MFETPLIERFSRVHPALPFFFWLPILAYFTFRALGSATGLPSMAGFVLVGALIWSLTEYMLHRFVFHRITPGPGGRRLHFVLHGVHHDFPEDGTRLVMPLGVSIPIGVTVYLVLRVVLGALDATACIDAIFVGFGIGYLSYDGIHYGTHHFRMAGFVGRRLKRYHMEHHHTGEEARWGVSSPLWDVVFGTMGERKQPVQTVVGS